MRITTSIQVIAITDVRTTSSIISTVPTTAGTTTLMMVDVAGTLLEGVASTLETVLIVEVVKCVWVSKRCVLISGTLLTGGITADDCDDGVTAEYVDTVEQFIRNTVSSAESQHISFSLLQTVQALALANVILMRDGVSVSFTSTVHHLACPVVMVLL